MLSKQEKSRLLDELFEFLRQPSIAAQDRGMDEMADMVEQKLQSIGAETKRLLVKDSYPYIYAEIGDGDRTLLIYDHYDVQPAEPLELWDSAPFSPEVRDGKIFARGVADNKGNLMFRIQAIRDYIKHHGELPIKIKWIVEGEEEIGSPHLADLSKQYGDLWSDVDICLWETGGVDEDDAPAMAIGMKGILYVELSVNLGGHDLHSGNASLVDSAVWRLVHALASLRDVDGNVILDGFEKSIVFPSAKEWELVENDTFDVERTLKSLDRKSFLSGETDKKKILMRHYFGGTCNICGIWAGFTEPGGIKTIIPSKATAKIDFRLIKDQTPGEVLQLLQQHLKKRGFSDVRVKELIREDVGKTDIENPLLQSVISSIEKGYGTKMNIKITSGGSGPVFYVANKFDIPVFHLGAEYPMARAHAPNENIRVTDYFKAFEVFQQSLSAIANG